MYHHIFHLFYGLIYLAFFNIKNLFLILKKKKKRMEKNSKLVQNRRQHITFYKNKDKYKNNLRVFKESVPERKNGALGDHVGDCVFLGTQANLQARSQDSAQGC